MDQPSEEERAALARFRQCRLAESRAEAALAARHQATGVAVARALSVEVPAADLAEELGVSRQRVYQIRDEAMKPKTV